MADSTTEDSGIYRTSKMRSSLTEPSLAALSASEYRRVGGIVGQPNPVGTVVMYSSEIGTTTPASNTSTSSADNKAKMLVGTTTTSNVRSLQPYNNSGSPKQSSCDYQRSKLVAALANTRQGVESGYADSAYGSNISTGSGGFAHNFVSTIATLPYGSLPNPSTTASSNKGYLPPSYGKVTASGSVALLQRRNQSRQQHKIHRSLSDSKYSDGYSSAGGSVQTAQKASWIGMSRVR